MTTIERANILAEPDVERLFPPSNWDHKPQRAIDRRWLVRDEGDDGQVYVELSCYDDASRKRYWSTLGTVRVKDGILSSLPMSNFSAMREPRARYSKGDFRDFADRALEDLRSLVGTEAVDEHLRGDTAPAAR